MPSRFQGRDFQTLRQEIIDFVKLRAPDTWDSNNAADPMIRFIEAVALLGDNLHYYIDAMRREADMATAQLASSVYSYALREGYTLVLPRSTHYRIHLYSESASEIDNVSFKKFDVFSLQNQEGNYYVLTPLQATNIYMQYPKKDISGDVLAQEPPEIEIVAGEVKEVRFTFSDIDYYSRIEVPEAFVDAEMCQLIAQSGQDIKEIYRVEDVVSDIQQANVYSLTPSFVNGVVRLYIEFPYNYRNLFPTNTVFTFKYLVITSETKPSDYFESNDFEGVVGQIVSYGGYRGYEDPESIKQNYKNYVRDFSSLVTKSDYKSFVNYNINSRCQVFDKSDEYNGNFRNIPVRTMYILSDLAYTEREELRKEILKRSSRSDNIFMIPYGKKLYRAFVIVEANLLNESENSIRSSIRTSLESFYNDIVEVRDPIESVIYFKVHSCNSSIARAWVILIEEGYRETVDGEEKDRSNFPTEEILTNPTLLHSYIDEDSPNYNYIFKFFYNLLPDDPDDNSPEPMKDLTYIDRYSDIQLKKDSVIYLNMLRESINRLNSFKGKQPQTKPSYYYQYPKTLPYSTVNEDLAIVSENSEFYYDSESIDQISINDPKYDQTHFTLPSLFDTIIWVYSI